MPQAKEPILIIANPRAGAAAGRASRARILEAARKELVRHGHAVHIGIEVDARGVVERAEAAARGGAPIVVAAGGDGTVNGVVNGLLQASGGLPSSVKLGVLPLGTGNVFAQNLGIGRDWKDACRVLRSNSTRCIDVACASPLPETRPAKSKYGPGQIAPCPRFFVLMGGIGFDAKVIEDTSLRLKFVLRDFAYALRSLQNAVVHRGSQMRFTFAEGEVYEGEAWLVMAGNAASYAWSIRFTDRAKLDDGYLDVCLFPFSNKLYSVQQVMQLLMGQHIERGTAQYWKTRAVRVESDPPVPVQLDGDEWGTTPLELSIYPSVLQVLAPPECASGSSSDLASEEGPPSRPDLLSRS